MSDLGVEGGRVVREARRSARAHAGVRQDDGTHRAAESRDSWACFIFMYRPFRAATVALL